ncbi:MAG: hypothetical protein RBT66_09905 [bacterium]|jgi:hypothetical protein|nr:hypothetical protein [bacterium]
MKEKSTEYQAGAALIDEGIQFKTEPVFGRKITLTIRPSRPGTIARISQKVTLLESVDEGNIQEFMQKGKNLKIIAGIIATAIINREVSRAWKYRWYKWLLLNRVPDMAHLYSYFLLVQKQMGPGFFFLIMSLTPAMNYLKKRTKKEENTGEGKPSGERSDTSRKPSTSEAKKS